MSLTKQITDLHHEKPHYWPFLYRRRRNFKNVSTNQIIFGQVFTVLVSLLAGLILDSHKESLILVPGVFLLLPGVIDLVASVTAALGAKVNHHLELARHKVLAIIVHDVGFTFLVTVLSSLVVGAIGGAVAAWLFDANFAQMVLISLITCTISAAFTLPVFALFTIALVNRGYNPDNLVGPIESSVVDVGVIFVVTVVVAIFS